jgi:hypothetical protein
VGPEPDAAAAAYAYATPRQYVHQVQSLPDRGVTLANGKRSTTSKQVILGEWLSYKMSATAD